jgi:sec-independent protein translocase protein TatA
MLTGLENPVHLLLIFLVIFLVFGAKRLPEIGRGLGTGMRDFKHALTTPPTTTTPTDDTPSAIDPAPTHSPHINSPT